MDKTNYDLVFSIGAACSCSMTLRRAGLQHLSFPGDWLTAEWHDETHPPLAHDLRERAATLCRGLDGFLDFGDLRFDRPHPWNGKDIYFNARTRYVFNHDFPAGEPLETALPHVLEKYRRRDRRLRELIRASKRVLVVRMDIPSDTRPKATLDDCRFARRLLAETFAPTAFDFALVSFERGRPYERLIKEHPEEGLTRFAFDYTNPNPDKDPLLPDLALTSRLLAERFAVRDYRTREEIAAHHLAAQRKKWAKVGARGPFGYFWKRLFRRLGGRGA